MPKTAPAKTPEPRILMWDIEATNLNASFGTILCIGYKWVGEPRTHVISILDNRGRDMIDDRRVVREFVKVFKTADYHATWYGSRYDLPMVRSKLIHCGDKPLPPIPHLDLWAAVRYRFRLHSNRLAVWQKFLDLPVKKTEIDMPSWLRAAAGNRAAMAEVVDHCSKDVRVLEQVFIKLRPWLTNEPARHLFLPTSHGACPSCGSIHTRRAGYGTTKTRRYAQHQCRDCGKWWSETVKGEGPSIATRTG